MEILNLSRGKCYCFGTPLTLRFQLSLRFQFSANFTFPIASKQLQVGRKMMEPQLGGGMIPF